MHYASADSMRRANSTSVKNLWENAEVLRDLILKDNKDSLGHAGEDGRWTESLIAHFLRENLPSDLEVSTGFVVDLKNERRSYQVDILVHYPGVFPPILRYGDAVIVSPDAVVAAISIKFRITRDNLENEIVELAEIGNICGGEPEQISPYLGLVGFTFENRATDGRSRFETFRQDIPKKFVEVYKRLGERPSPGSRGQRQRGVSGNEVVDSLVVLEGFVLHADSRAMNGAATDRDSVRLRWGGATGDNSYVLGLEMIRGIVEHWRGGAKVTRSQWPSPTAVGMQNAGEVRIVCENRPIVMEG